MEWYERALDLDADWMPERKLMYGALRRDATVTARRLPITKIADVST